MNKKYTLAVCVIVEIGFIFNYYVLTNRVGNGMNISPSSAPGVLDPEGVDDGCYIHTLRFTNWLNYLTQTEEIIATRERWIPREDPRVCWTPL